MKYEAIMERQITTFSSTKMNVDGGGLMYPGKYVTTWIGIYGVKFLIDVSKFEGPTK